MRASRTSLYRSAVAVLIPAFVGAAFGLGSSLFVFGYQQSTSAESVRTAFVGEIEAILVALREPTRKTATAWERKRALGDYNFYYPRAVFDGNVGRLGELRDRKLVHDIALLYATLEQAREEGRRLKASTSDSEGMLRYTAYLCRAFGLTLDLIEGLTGETPKIVQGTDETSQVFNSIALKIDREFLAKITEKLQEAAFKGKFGAPSESELKDFKRSAIGVGHGKYGAITEKSDRDAGH